MLSDSVASGPYLNCSHRVGKKILATGNGKCNMTNADMSLSHYHGLMSEEASRTLVKSVFDMFSPDDTIRFFEELGVPVMFKNGVTEIFGKVIACLIILF